MKVAACLSTTSSSTWLSRKSGIKFLFIKIMICHRKDVGQLCGAVVELWDKDKNVKNDIDIVTFV